ncbi:MAG: hypothetical protein HYX68_28400 [Planctomycetes bacterium]|nr:hypothetical protein [Planctomycetota bacterium]
MGSTPASELHAFHVFIGEKLSNGSAHLSPEEALDAWRDLYPDPFDDEDDLAAIEAALDDVDRGIKGISFKESDRQIREEFNLPAPDKR